MKPKSGNGSYYLRGSVWWIKYYQNGKAIRESTHTPMAATAIQMLRERTGEVSRGEPVNPKADRVTVDELLEDLLTDYRVNGRRSVGRLEELVAHLRPAFGHRRSVAVRGADVNDYKLARLKAGAAAATINRELAALRRAYSLGKRGEKIRHMPTFELLQEAPPRAGFFEREQFEAVRANLPEALRPLVTVAYITGWRIPSELLTLQWHQVDFAAGSLRLEPGMSKNREARMFFMTPELRQTLETQRAATDALARETGRIIPWVFHRQGAPILSFYDAWATACLKAGLATKTVAVENGRRVVKVNAQRIPHDFRRTAVRNLERAGVPRSVAMKMSGHKTENVYRRYAIVSDGDLRAAADKLATLAAMEAGTRTGTTGTVTELRPVKGIAK